MWPRPPRRCSCSLGSSTRPSSSGALTTASRIAWSVSRHSVQLSNPLRRRRFETADFSSRCSTHVPLASATEAARSRPSVDGSTMPGWAGGNATTGCRLVAGRWSRLTLPGMAIGWRWRSAPSSPTGPAARRSATPSGGACSLNIAGESSKRRTGTWWIEPRFAVRSSRCGVSWPRTRRICSAQRHESSKPRPGRWFTQGRCRRS